MSLWNSFRPRKQNNNNYNGVYGKKANVDNTSRKRKFSHKTTLVKLYKNMTEDGYFRCPNCAKTIRPDIEYCPECGFFNDFRAIKKFKGRFHTSDSYPSAGDYVSGNYTEV